MNKNIVILRWLLFAGSLYFFLVSAAHLIGLKIPFLFIYYDAPSYIYQDRIISFLAFGWSVFLFTAFLNPIKNTMLIRAILFTGFGAIIGLEIINFTILNDISLSLVRTKYYQLETLVLAIYLVFLIIFYNKSRDII